MGHNAHLWAFCPRWALEEEREVHQTVKTKFDEHFVVRRNTIFERAKFNCRCQEGENVDSYITSIFCLAVHCEYGALHDEMIRDRIVVQKNASCSFHTFPKDNVFKQKWIANIRRDLGYNVMECFIHLFV